MADSPCRCETGRSTRRRSNEDHPGVPPLWRQATLEHVNGATGATSTFDSHDDGTAPDAPSGRTHSLAGVLRRLQQGGERQSRGRGRRQFLLRSPHCSTPPSTVRMTESAVGGSMWAHPTEMTRSRRGPRWTTKSCHMRLFASAGVSCRLWARWISDGDGGPVPRRSRPRPPPGTGRAPVEAPPGEVNRPGGHASPRWGALISSSDETTDLGSDSGIPSSDD